MNVKSRVGLKLKEIRKSLKLSQEKFAEIIGISRHSLSELERGLNFTSAETLDNIHKNLKIDYEELFSFDKKEAGEWYCEQHPERLFTDWLLRGQIPGPMLCRREQRGFSLGAPFHTDRPLALPGLFCLAQPESRPSGVHLVWRFDEKGWPTMGRESCEVCRGHQKSVRQG